MAEYRMEIHSIQDIMGFVEAAKELPGCCEVVSGRYRVNAKSLMAMLTIPEMADMTLETAQEAKELPEQLRKYIGGKRNGR